MDKEIQAFKKKDMMNMEMMKNNVRNLGQITANLEAALTELEVSTALQQRKTEIHVLDIAHMHAFIFCLPKRNIDLILNES